MFYYKVEKKRKDGGVVGTGGILFSEPKGGNPQNEKQIYQEYAVFVLRSTDSRWKKFLFQCIITVSVALKSYYKAGLINLNLVVAQSFQYHLS